MNRKQSTIVGLLSLLMVLMWSAPALAAPEGAISNELRARVTVRTTETTLSFRADAPNLEPGYLQGGIYQIQSAIYDWLGDNLIAASIIGYEADIQQVTFIEFLENDPAQGVSWRGYTISDSPNVSISESDQILENHNFSSPANISITINSIKYQGQIHQLTTPMNLNITVNPYFSGSISNPVFEQASVEDAGNRLRITGIKEESGLAAWSPPAAASCYQRFGFVEGLSPEASRPLDGQIQKLESTQVYIGAGSWELPKNLEPGSYELYLLPASGSTACRLEASIGHMDQAAAKPVNYLKAGSKELLRYAVTLSWAEGGSADLILDQAIAGETVEFKINAFATAAMNVKIAVFNGNEEQTQTVSLNSGINSDISITLAFDQPGTYELSFYALPGE